MWPARGISCIRAPGMSRVSSSRQRRRSHLVLAAAQHERRDVDRGGAVALVGEPYGLGADPVSGGIDCAPSSRRPRCGLRGRRAGRAGHRRALRPSRANRRSRQSSGRRWRGPRDGRRKLSARISEAQRVGRCMVHRDRDDSAERQPADMRAIDAEPVHRGEDRRAHNRRASCLRARDRCRRSPDNRRRPRGAFGRNGRAAAATRICRSRRREGRRSGLTRRPRLPHSRWRMPLLVVTLGIASSWQRRHAPR